LNILNTPPQEASFFGHVVNKNRLAVDPTKVKVVVEWERPTNVREIRSFLSLASYYRKFIKGFFALSGSLTALTRKNAEYEWSEKFEASFQELKQRLMAALVLTLPMESVGMWFIQMHRGRDWDVCLCSNARLCLMPQGNWRIMKRTTTLMIWNW